METQAGGTADDILPTKFDVSRRAAVIRPPKDNDPRIRFILWKDSALCGVRVPLSHTRSSARQRGTGDHLVLVQCRTNSGVTDLGIVTIVDRQLCQSRKYNLDYIGARSHTTKADIVLVRDELAVRKFACLQDWEL